MAQRGSGYARQEGERYFTPDWVTELLLGCFRLPRRLWECAAGDGGMARCLRRHGHRVVASDIAPAAAGSRQAIINDDLNAFTTIPAKFGTAVATRESDIVWEIITGNPNMADGVALFHAATHKNLAGAGTALSVATIGAARAEMAKQKGLDGKSKLNIRPAFLLVPSELELTAEQMLTSALVAAKVSDTVPNSIRSLTPIAEPRLSDASATAWYLVGSPAQIDTIEYAYLEGQIGPYIETRMGFDVDGMEIKCRIDFGAKAIDWRGLYKNPGA